MRQRQVVAHARFSQTLLLISLKPRGLGARQRYGRNPSKFSGGQCQSAGFMKHRCTAWIATPYPYPAQHHQGRNFDHGSESIPVKQVCCLMGGIIPGTLLKPGVGLISPQIRCHSIEIMLGAVSDTVLQVAGCPCVVMGIDGAPGQIVVRAGGVVFPSPLQGESQTPFQVGTSLLILALELSSPHSV